MSVVNGQGAGMDTPFAETGSIRKTSGCFINEKGSFTRRVEPCPLSSHRLFSWFFPSSYCVIPTKT